MSIDVKTLRIGAHINVNGVRAKVVQLNTLSWDGKDAFHALVRGVSPDDGEVREVGCFVDDEAAQPIEITPELLKEMGFKYHEYDNGKLWEMEFADGFHSYLNLEFDEDTTGVWEANLWDCKELVVNAKIEFLHELENYVYLVYNKELIQD